MTWSPARLAIPLVLAVTCAACHPSPRVPDLSGVWAPNWTDQQAQVTSNPAPWTPAARAVVQRLTGDEAAGRPKGLFVNCLPEGMPSWMLVSHSAMEILLTPGRVTMLGEADGNQMRRIYTDGRPHPDDPAPSFHGHSIGRWEGDTLVVDTIAVLPQSYVAISEAVGVPNDGDLHVVERIHLTSPGVLHDELEITAPRIFTGPWRTTREYFRQRGREHDLIESVCLQGHVIETKDEDGNAAFAPAPQTPLGTPREPEEK